MNLTEKVKKSLSFQRKSDLTDQCENDLETIATELQIEEKAKIAAESNLPDSQSIKPDGTEREIQNYFEKRMANINRIVNDGLSMRNTSITDTNLEDERALINNYTEHSILAVKSMMAKEFRFLKQLKKESNDLQEEYEQFRVENNLERTANYPDSQIFHFAVIMLFFLLESLGNGFFFAEGSELGLLGGIAQAVMVAAINISISFFLIGTLFRYKNHVSSIKKIFAYLGLSVYLAFIVGFNLLVAHFRDYFAISPDEAGELALQRFLDQPLQLEAFNSWILFFMGVLFALFALFDGYKRDDSYPGYGKIHRRLAELNEEYEDQRDEVVNQIESVRQNFLDKLEEMKQAVLLKHTRLVHLVEDKQAFVAEYEQGISNFIHAANTLIYRYRDINMRYRTQPVPTYFSSDWQVSQPYKIRGAHDDIEQVEQQKQLFNNFPRYSQQRANEIEKLYISFFRQLHEIDPEYEVHNHSQTQLDNV